jgi:hypothetical protein
VKAISGKDFAKLLEKKGGKPGPNLGARTWK